MIRIVSVPQDAEPVVVQIPPDLEPMQALVGGYIEMIVIPELPGIDLVCNEEGIGEGLLANGCGILGPYFFTRHNNAGDPVDLTDADVAAVLKFVAARRDDRHAYADFNEGKTDEPPANGQLFSVHAAEFCPACGRLVPATETTHTGTCAACADSAYDAANN